MIEYIQWLSASNGAYPLPNPQAAPVATQHSNYSASISSEISSTFSVPHLRLK